MRQSPWSGIIGLIFTLISFAMLITDRHQWSFPAFIGVWLIFDYLAQKKGRITTFMLLKNKPAVFIHLYVIMLLFGMSIEYAGRFLTGYWYYPKIGSLFMELLLILLYPFILFSCREMFSWLESITKNYWSALFGSVLLGVIIWEVPNVFSPDWVYVVLFLPLTLFSINILVILGWFFLIIFPLFIYKALGLN
ncbi:hypothetical protein J4460_07505 [Candidatus Woesearchaeota archaeon]|nr:hypothetical protein [Candidatus Woesearchaeota archaeon]HIH37753.1 hypothetical protein [Candidatus Woesearchaeota archaeon]HIH48936.1 hypothetical protein [Candidatus Woesearchaeota archaeon]HIJ02705.1 hypothetical protein [Candidatus Woesearchaeota archaeon]